MLCQPWMTSADVLACGCPNTEDPIELQRWIDTATETIYLLSGAQYGGECEEVYRPPVNCVGSWPGTGYPSYPTLVAGAWYNVAGCGVCPSGLLLPFDYPREVTQVKVDGVVVPSTAWRLDGRFFYLGAPHHWPHNQDLGLADTEPGTFSITVLYGLDPTAALRQAAIDLAAEIGKGCSGAPCALPARVTSIVKQGVSISLGVAEELLAAGKTGLASVDGVLAAFNPTSIRHRARFISPDVAATLG